MSGGPIAPRRKVMMPQDERNALGRMLGAAKDSAGNVSPLALKTAALGRAVEERNGARAAVADPEHEARVLASLVGDGAPAKRTRTRAADDDDDGDDDKCKRAGCDHDRASHARGEGCLSRGCKCKAFKEEAEEEDRAGGASASAIVADPSRYPVVMQLWQARGSDPKLLPIIADQYVRAQGGAPSTSTPSPAPSPRSAAPKVSARVKAVTDNLDKHPALVAMWEARGKDPKLLPTLAEHYLAAQGAGHGGAFG